MNALLSGARFFTFMKEKQKKNAYQ